MKFWVGTSGYSYKPWLGNFYPERLPAKEMLRFYATCLPAVEINNTFYRLPNESVVKSWAAQVGTDFRFALKAPQQITHKKRLKETKAEMESFLRAKAGLEAKAGVVLFQLPPSMPVNIERLDSFLSLLPEDGNVVFEFRHASWFVEDVFTRLRARNYALCMSETDDNETTDLISTANWGYARLRRSDYGSIDLLRWKERILSQPWDHAYLFFKHENEAIGPKLAMEFLELTGPTS